MPAPDQQSSKASVSVFRRLLLLVGCVALGLIIGYIGERLTSQAMWFLAVPVCIAIGWIFVANPDECVAPKCSPRQKDTDS
ncbi:MAG: hypothetical protein WC236_02045 [Gallionellaceae bacterium]|jgi:F0F1-type ATP synthase assembly protein I